MLVLTRKANERIMVGDSVCITLLGTRGGRVRLGIEAPDGVTILRAELLAQSLSREAIVAAEGIGPEAS